MIHEPAEPGIKIILNAKGPEVSNFTNSFGLEKNPVIKSEKSNHGVRTRENDHIITTESAREEERY